jgi:hypothetical protein
MNVRMIILLGIFVWAPMMAYLGWKYLQTFDFVQRHRAVKRRAKRALLPAGDGHMIHNEERRRMRRSF